MLLLFCLTLLILFLLIISICKIIHTNKKLNAIHLKTEELYHDINSSLVIFKLTLDSLKDLSLEIHKDNLISLINSLDESVHHMEKSFRHWNL